MSEMAEFYTKPSQIHFWQDVSRPHGR